ncbi:protoheme IX farnesyltransferase [Paenibacillus flagellatus]|uniref:Protoheme IX farnesyltransferase n=1 Tax=Paenibacillus flagellatus TaxID=2211139 RepID=A0A2V5KAM8_9BACL|nr:protoheme IX farnesyltransferase [Paenibacillus flagellatus]
MNKYESANDDENTASRSASVPSRWSDWKTVVKPGILMSNLFAAVAGGFLATGRPFGFPAFVYMLVGTALIVAAASMTNNVLDRHRDTRMARTRSRALPSGRLSPRIVAGAAAAAAGSGLLLLYVLVNPLCMLLGIVGLFVYDVVYTLWLKPRSTWSTSVGGVAGAMPPMIGYCSVSGELDAGAWLLFLLMFAWQPPHFWALGILKREEYRAAGYPLLPVVKGVRRTKLQMLPYAAALLPIPGLLYRFGYGGPFFTAFATGLLLVWFVMCVRGLTAKDEARWAKGTFRFSLYALTLSFAAIIAESALSGTAPL